MDWVRATAVDQLGFYWDYTLWPRLRGLTDDEYFWEPVAGCWSVRPDADGNYVSDGAAPGKEPDPPPVTTLAWRINHIAVGCFHSRASTFFGDGSVPADADMFDPRHLPASLPATAAQATDFLHRSYEWWHDGLLSMSAAEFEAPLGPRAAHFANQSMAQLALHLNRETFHHGGEIGLLRDFYRAGFAAG
jgi:DinB family protein